MYREKLLARTRSIKVLNYAMQNEEGSEACERFVEMLGLKTFFSAFMGKVCFNQILSDPANHVPGRNKEAETRINFGFRG